MYFQPKGVPYNVGCPSKCGASLMTTAFLFFQKKIGTLNQNRKEPRGTRINQSRRRRRCWCSGSSTSLPSPRQQDAGVVLQRRFRKTRFVVPLQRLLPATKAFCHQNHVQANRRSSRRSNCNSILIHSHSILPIIGKLARHRI